MMDLVRGLIAVDKKMREEHIGYILREVIKVSVGHYDSLINLLANERPTRMPFSAPDSHFSRIVTVHTLSCCSPSTPARVSPFPREPAR